uniref:Glycerol-3-phosphate dehydrogenase n=1 Tax=Macrostomum lignano TaxID=282301 RepID=A0A1I8FQ48_9PLAT
ISRPINQSINKSCSVERSAVGAFRRLCYLAAGGGALAVATLQGVPWALEAYNLRRNYVPPSKTDPHLIELMDAKLPTRQEQLDSLSTEEFDVLIIGGGATGCGCALDAVSRGLRTHWLRNLTSPAALSSRSTKLIHGAGCGTCRRLCFNLDIEQYRMVCRYFWAGIKMYDLVSGTQILKPSFYLSKSRALEYFPMLQKDALKGALVYYDGQHEDARMCLSIGLTAAKLGASIANYCEVVEILKSTDPTTNKEVVSGARVLDRTTGKEFAIKANPERMGLLDPATADGRVIFFLPWQNCTIAGTTDTPCELTDNPHPTEDDVKFILKEIKHYLSPDIDIRRGDVLSAWAAFGRCDGPEQVGHAEHRQESHHRSVGQQNGDHCGGKWTTYRQMSEETIDKVIEVANLQAKTKGLLLDGAPITGPNLFIRLVQEYGVEPSVAQHLANVYGDKSLEIIKLESLSGQRWPVVGKRLHPNYPYLESEVRWATREYACRAVTSWLVELVWPSPTCTPLWRPCPRVVQIMGEEPGLVRNEANGCSIPSICPLRRLPDLMSKFRKMDADNKGFITLNDLERYFKAAQIMDMIDEVDLNRNGRIEMSEFLQFMSAAKSGTVGSSRFKHVLDRTSHSDKDHVISVDRSGGGV